MFVLHGDLHPMVNADREMTYVIRRIHGKVVYYLLSHDISTDEAVWTQKYHRAHKFNSEKDATNYLSHWLGKSRAEQCDLFTEHEIWTI